MMRITVVHDTAMVAISDLTEALNTYANDLETKGVDVAAEVIRIVTGQLLEYMLQALQEESEDL